MNVNEKLPTAKAFPEAGAVIMDSAIYVDDDVEKQYRRKVDFWVLPLLCLVRSYF